MLTEVMDNDASDGLDHKPRDHCSSSHKPCQWENANAVEVQHVLQLKMRPVAGHLTILDAPDPTGAARYQATSLLNLQRRLHCRAASMYGHKVRPYQKVSPRHSGVPLMAGLSLQTSTIFSLPQHSSTAPGVSASRAGSLGQNAGPNISCVSLHQQQDWPCHLGGIIINT